MKTLRLVINKKSVQIFAVFTLLMAFVLAGCGAQTSSPADAVLPEASPELMVEEFYQWYSMYPGNALVDGAYRNSPYFSQDYIRDLDKQVEKGGLRADPIVCAQDIANSFTATGTEFNGTTAYVRVLSGFGNEMDVEMKPFDGLWKITTITCIHN
jgi:hypothetical protein